MLYLSILIIVFSLAIQGCYEGTVRDCGYHADSCTCGLTEADTTLTVELLDKYVKYPLEGSNIPLHFIARNNTGNFYNKYGNNEVVVERFENDKWKSIPARQNDVLFLNDGIGRFTGLFPWEEKADSFFLQPNRFVYEKGLYRARLTFVRSRAITETSNLFAYLRDTDEKLSRYVEFEILETIPEDTLKKKNLLLCNYAKRQMAINERRFKDSTMTVLVDENEIEFSSLKELKPIFYMSNNTPAIYLFRPHYDYHLERLEGNKWQALPKKEKKVYKKEFEFFEWSLSGYPVGTFFYPGEKSFFPIGFELFDHSFQKGKYRIVVSVRKMRKKEKDMHSLWCEETGEKETHYAEFEIVE